MTEWPRGVQLGEGVYTTLLWQSGPPPTWPLHLARLQRDAAQVGLPPPPLEGLAERIAKHLQQCAQDRDHAESLWRLRIRWWADGEVSLAQPAQRGLWDLQARLVQPGERPAEPLRLVTAGQGRWPRLWAGAKITSIGEDLAWRRWAVKQGADDALLCDVGGHWSETPTAALLLGLVDGRVGTPGPGHWPVRSTTLQAVDERLRLQDNVVLDELSLGQADAGRVRWALLLNAVVGGRPVAQLDGVALQPPPGYLQRLAWELTQPRKLT